MAQESKRKRSSTQSSTTKRATSRRASQKPTSWLSILLVVALLFVLYLYESGRLDQWLGGSDKTPTPVAGSGDIQAYFTTPTLVYPDRRDQRGASPLLNAVLADINTAQASVELATFDLDLPQMTDALIGAKQRGATVRVIVDSENLDTPEVAEETGRLQNADIEVRFDDREPFMHNKFLVVDDALAWTGSWNVTANDTFRNNNNFVRFANREIAADYRSEFDQMFDGTFGRSKSSLSTYQNVQIGQTHTSVYFSPEDGVAQYVLDQINTATQNIRFMSFSYTSDGIAQAMIDKHNGGIRVDGVFESQNARGTGAEFAKLQSGGVNVLEDGNCYIMHHKTIIIDNRAVITGSYNFTASAENDNDENLVIIDDPAIVQAYLEEFDRVYAQAENPLRCGS